MNIYYVVTSEDRRNRVLSLLSENGHRATAQRGPMAEPKCVRVWRVEPQQEAEVMELILRGDPGARPMTVPPTPTHA